MPGTPNHGSNQSTVATINPLALKEEMSDSESPTTGTSSTPINSKSNKSSKSNLAGSTTTTIKREIDSSPLSQSSLSNSGVPHNILHQNIKKENNLRINNNNNSNSNNKNNNNLIDKSSSNSASSLIDGIIGSTNTGSLSQHHIGTGISHIKRGSPPDNKGTFIYYLYIHTFK